MLRTEKLAERGSKGTDMPEMISLEAAQDMARAAATEAVQAAMGPLLAGLASQQSSDAPTLATLLDGFTKAIGTITAQTAGKTFIAPEILAKRRAAADRMESLLAAARASGIAPRYQLVGEVVFDDTVLVPVIRDPATKREQPRKLGWKMAPNMAMRPIDDTAREIFQAFIESIGENPPPAEAPSIFRPEGTGVLLVDGKISKTGYLAEAPNGSQPAGTGNLVLEGINETQHLEYTRVLGSVSPAAVHQVS